MKGLAVLFALTFLTAACSSGTAGEIRLVSRVPHDTSALRCDDDASLTFGSDLERPTALSEAFRLLELEGTHCEAEMEDVTLRNLDGLTAVASGFSPISSRTLQFTDAPQPCDLAGVSEPFTAGTVRFTARSEITLRFDDGAVATLTPELGTFVMSTCYYETGRWSSSAGSLRGQNGSYRWTERHLQIELVLIDS